MGTGKRNVTVSQKNWQSPLENLYVNSKGCRILGQPLGRKVGVLISAAPRSGTRYITYVLQDLGIKMKHEEVDKDGLVSWQHITPSPFSVEPRMVMHIVREPLKTIASMAFALEPCAYPFMWYSIYGYVPIIGKDFNLANEEDYLSMAVQFWVLWNELIEEKAVYRYKLEEFTSSLIRIYEVIKRMPFVPRMNASVPVGINAIEHRDTTWDELFKVNPEYTRRAQEVSVRYGYSI